MTWIVLGEKNGRIQLVSKSEVSGIVPKGSYLTIDEGETKFILRVDETVQNQPYSPSPMVIDMNLSPLVQDQKCQNIISTYRVKDISNRSDGFIDYIKPQSIARRSNQEEIDLAMGTFDPTTGTSEKGPKVFIATVHACQNQLLMDENSKIITATLPESMFYHQMLICGKTGSGKTVSLKYLAQYFVEELGGAVLAINVKEADLLKLDKPSITKNPKIKEEWKNLGKEAHGVDNFSVYYPATGNISQSKDVTQEKCHKISLKVSDIDPEALVGLLQGITDIGAQNLPNIFRAWKKKMLDAGKDDELTFANFRNYFQQRTNEDRIFPTLNSRGDLGEPKLHSGTCESILRTLDVAVEFFDNPDAKLLDDTDILQTGKISVIDTVADKNGIKFGAILLRDLLHKIVRAKSENRSKVPILIIIDEVHRFYDPDAQEALGDLDTICRTGRSQKIGVVFASQNPRDIPKGLSSVINTKIFFKTDIGEARDLGVRTTTEEMESLKKGYAVASIHDLSQLKILKFPLSFSGVFEEEKDE